MDDTLKLILTELQALKAGQATTNNRLDTMQEDISSLQKDITALRTDVEQVKDDVEQVKEDVEQVKEDTALTRDVVNGISEWIEVAADVLKIKYPVKE